MEPVQDGELTMASVFEDITLPQAVLLLSLDDATGQTEAGYYQPVFAGAALTELFLCGTIELQDDQIVALRHRQRLGAFLDLCDRAIGGAPKQQSLAYWIRDLANQKEFIATLADELCHLGALSKEKTRVFGVFSRTIWPEASPVFETRLKRDLRALMSDPAAATDERVTLTLALADAVDLLKFNFEADELSTCADRIASLATGEGLTHPALQPLLMAVKTAIQDAHTSADSATDTILQ